MAAATLSQCIGTKSVGRCRGAQLKVGALNTESREEKRAKEGLEIAASVKRGRRLLLTVTRVCQLVRKF